MLLLKFKQFCAVLSISIISLVVYEPMYAYMIFTVLPFYFLFYTINMFHFVNKKHVMTREVEISSEKFDASSEIFKKKEFKEIYKKYDQVIMQKNEVIVILNKGRKSILILDRSEINKGSIMSHQSYVDLKKIIGDAL